METVDYVSDLYEYKPELKYILPGLSFNGKDITHRVLGVRQLLLYILKNYEIYNKDSDYEAALIEYFTQAIWFIDNQNVIAFNKATIKDSTPEKDITDKNFTAFYATYIDSLVKNGMALELSTFLKTITTRGVGIGFEPKNLLKEIDTKLRLNYYNEKKTACYTFDIAKFHTESLLVFINDTLMYPKLTLSAPFFVRYKKLTGPTPKYIIMQDEYGQYYFTDATGKPDWDYTHKIKKLYESEQVNKFFGSNITNDDATKLMPTCILAGDNKSCYEGLKAAVLKDEDWAMLKSEQKQYTAFRILKALGILPVPMNNVFDFPSLLKDENKTIYENLYKNLAADAFNTVTFKSYVEKLINFAGKVEIKSLREPKYTQLQFKIAPIASYKAPTTSTTPGMIFIPGVGMGMMTGGANANIAEREKINNLRKIVNEHSKLSSEQKEKINKLLDDTIKDTSTLQYIDTQISTLIDAYTIAQKYSPNLIFSGSDLVALRAELEKTKKEIKTKKEKTDAYVTKLLYLFTPMGPMVAAVQEPVTVHA